MALALYRKYRPATFAELADQNHVKVTLLAELEQDAVSHAYLFTGPRGVGKTTTARLLAKAVNCKKRRKGEPCNDCESCRRSIDGQDLDLVEIDAASNTGVDHVREHIIESARYQPLQGRAKVYIIDEVHMLSASAFNALLKTLEEPPPHVIFVLATTEVQKVPETIISRCQRFDFRKIPVVELISRLERIADAEKVRVDADVLADVARRADGSSRDAEVLLGQLLALGESSVTSDVASIVLPRSDRKAIEQLLTELVHRDRVAAIRLITTFSEEGGNLAQFADDLVVFCRNLLLRKLGQDVPAFDETPAVAMFLSSASVDELQAFVQAFLRCRDAVRRQDIPELPLELAILDLLPVEDVSSSTSASTSPDVATKRSERVSSDSNDQPSPHPSTRPAEAARGQSSKKKRPEQTAFSVTFESIQKRWPDVILALRKRHHSLALALKVSELVRFEDGKLTLGFSFPFYLERLAHGENRRTVERVLEEVFGEPIQIMTVSGSSGAKPTEKPSLWEQLSAVFEAEG